MKSKRYAISSLFEVPTAFMVTFLLIIFLSHSSCCEAKTKKKMLYENYKNLCRGLPVISRKHENHLQWMFKTIGETKIVGSTSQNEAACWMFRQGKIYSSQRYALAV